MTSRTRGAALLILSLAWAMGASAQAQGAVVPVAPLHDADGKLFGYSSNEPGLYFLVPRDWKLLPRSGAPSAALSAAGHDESGRPLFDLRIVLAPTYSAAAAANLRLQHPSAMFFPVPRMTEEVQIYLPPELGSVAARLTPEDTFHSALAIYYRLRLDAAQVSALSQLAQSGLALQGVVTTQYLTSEGQRRSAVPMTILLERSMLVPQAVLPAPAVTRWLQDILESTRLHLQGALDGTYPLGGGISVTLRDSLLEGELMNGRFEAQQPAAGTLRCAAIGSPNLQGKATFFVPEIGASIAIDYTALFEAELDLETMMLTLTTFDIVSADVNGASSPFYKGLLQKLLQDPSVRQQLGATLSSELQARILNETLFSLELP